MGGVLVMLLGGKGTCQQCGCVSCDACTATCTNPHTGSAFETVYTRYFEGAEAGNVSDGYLTATGDSDTSDPYDGMDGTGPWYQQVGGGFTLGGSSPGTRFPCYVRVSFWRNSYTLGASTIPPPSSTLTENVVEVTVSTGALVAPDGRVITPSDGTVAVADIPLVSGSGDASGLDPRTGGGTVSFAPQCWNVETIFSIQARVRWNTKKRQHVVYGIVRECYEIGTPCATVCSGNPPPSALYLTVSNAATTSGTFGGTLPNGTYAMDRIPGLCSSYLTWLTSCPGTPFYTSYATVNSADNAGGRNVTLNYFVQGASECGAFIFSAVDNALAAPCGTGTIASGSGTWVWIPQSSGSTPSASGTLDWSVTA